MAGIGLVGHQPRQVRHLLLEVGVDGDGRPVVALVVVEARPRLVCDYLVDDGLRVGQWVLGADSVAQGAGERVDALLETLRRDLLASAVGLHPVGERTASAQRRVDPAVRVAVSLGVALDDVDVEVLPDLVDESDVLPRELAARTGQGLQVGGQVVGPLDVQAVGVRDRLQQPLRGPGELRRVGGRLGRHRLAQRRIAGERVDVALFDAVEPQTEQQVLANQGGGLHGHHRNCHPPQARSASPRAARARWVL
jgi:hypothetical protein